MGFLARGSLFFFQKDLQVRNFFTTFAAGISNKWVYLKPLLILTI